MSNMNAPAVAERPFLEVTIAQITPADERFHAVMKLRSEVLDAALDLPAQRAPTAADLAPSSTHFVAMQGEQVVGALRLQHQRGIIHQLNRVVVTPSLQRSGIGRELANEAEAVASNLGSRVMYLWARASAEPFYLRQGYHYTGLGQSHDGAFFRHMSKLIVDYGGLAYPILDRAA